jgi:pyruvate,orthophosphate dikinase
MLQVRVGKRSPQAALRMAVDMAEDESFPVSRRVAVERVARLLAHPPTNSSVRGSSVVPLVTGLPASPGFASGPIVTNPDAAHEAAEAGRPAILVRAETSPDDVHGMAKAAGILTSRGGLASHAAVVARGWGIPAVVGAAGIDVRDGEVVVGDRVLRAGDVITIDGSSGGVFEGAIPGATDVVPEARTLLAWARDLGILIGESSDGEAPGVPETDRTATPDDCLQALAIKGFTPIQGVADVTLTTTDAVRPILDRLVVDGLVAEVGGAYRLTESGRSRASALLEAERAAWGVGGAVAALDAFLDLDQRVKAVVTAWQLRDGPDGQAVNDHSDAAYDADVIERLGAIHADAMAWLVPVESGNARLAGYRVRLGRAIEQVVAGDGRYVASPRVDSYHGVWFELHEDLIQLAGRTREDEVAAGRA